jgi:hypothetical protein
MIPYGISNLEEQARALLFEIQERLAFDKGYADCIKGKYDDQFKDNYDLKARYLAGWNSIADQIIK